MFKGDPARSKTSMFSFSAPDVASPYLEFAHIDFAHDLAGLKIHGPVLLVKMGRHLNGEEAGEPVEMKFTPQGWGDIVDQARACLDANPIDEAEVCGDIYA